MSRPRPSVRSLLVGFALALTLVAAPIAAPAYAAANPYERGPAPTVASISAVTGPYATATVTVARSSVSGFGGGTIYYPTSTADGTFGAIALVPGFTNTQSAVAWYGPRIASQGFVVFIIDTTSTLDSPESRGTQLLKALDYLTATSSIRTRIDTTRLGTMGYSMGGGGSLNASKTRPALQASIPLAPYDTATKSFSTVTVPTMIFGGQNDTTAPPASHGLVFYNSLPSTTDKAFLSLKGATHSAPTSANTTIAKYSISWLKRFIDNDTRYDQFLCPLPTDTTLYDVRGNCPHTS